MESIQLSLTFFFNAVALLILLAFTAGSQAEVFKCVDEATGQMTFTDKACPDDTPGEYQFVGNANIDTGYDRNATAGEKQNRDATAKSKQNSRQQQNSQAKNGEDRGKAQKELDKNSKVDRYKNTVSFENSMGKKNCVREHSLEYCRSLYD